MAAFLFSLALAGCGGGGGGSGFLGDAGGNVGDGAEPGASVVLDSGEGITEERRQGVAVKVAGLDLGGEGKVRAEDVRVSENPEILNQNPFATAEAAPESVAEARGFERQSVGTERKTPGYKAFEVAVPADNPLMTVAVWISETAPEEEVELPEGKPERDPEAPRKFLYVRLQVYVSTRNFAAVEGGGVEVLETQVIAVEERLPDPKPPAGADECEAAGWKAARVDGNAINCLIPLTSGGEDFEGCVLAGEFEPLCSEAFGEDFAFPTKLDGEARYVFNCGEGMIPEGSNTIGATQCFSEAAVNCAAGSLPANGMTQADLNVALRLAARRGDAGQVCEMLRRGAEVNDDLNGTEFTALQEAVSEGHLAAAELLLANGAEVNARKEGAGPSALDLAARAKNAEIAAVLRAAEGRCFVESGGLCEETVVAGVCAAGTLGADGLTQGELDAGMISAAEGGDADEVCEYLRRGADVEAQKSGNLRTALMVAAEEGHADVVELLLDNGAEVNRRGGNGGYGGRPNPGRWRDYPDSNWPALLYASSRGHADVVRIMLENGADVELGDDRKRRPLWEAAFYGHQDVMDLLLDNGADVDVADAWGITPLHAPGPHYGYPGDPEWPYAAEVAEYLISRGANVNALDTWGRSPLDLYAGWNHPNAAAVLRDAGGRCFVESGALCEVAVASDTVCTAGTLAADGKTQAQLDAGLIAAARDNDLAEVCEYLRRGANVDAQESEWRYYKRTPLMIAATDGNLELGKLLRRNGADVNFQGGNYRNDIDSAPPSNGDRKTPALHYAAGAGHKDFVEWLLSEGADLHAEQIALGRDTLWEAAFWGRTEIVKLLLSRGGNPNNQSRWTAAPLGSVIHHATHRALYGSPRWGIADTFPVPTQSDWATVISLLVAGGADVNIRFGDGESPLDMAVSRNSAKYAEQIRGYGGRCFVRSGPLCEATVATPVTGDTICAAGTLAADGLTQAELDAGMLNSVFNSDLDEVCDYLRRGANIAAHTAAGHPALVMVQSNLEMAKLLLANGADPNQRESLGNRWPPVMFIRQGADVIALYLSHGADPNAGVLNGESWKPLHEAAYYNDWRVMEALVSGGADPNVQTTRPGWRGGAPLHYVFDGTRADSGLAVSVLLAGGAEVNARDGRGRSGLDLAARQGDADAAAVLRGAGGVCFVETGPLCEVEVAAPEPVVGTVVASDTVCTAGSLSADGKTQAQLDAGLISAVRADNLEDACEHLRRGADVNGGDANGYSALMHAGANLEMGGLLLANGAEVHTQWPNGRGWWTPLYMHGHPDAIEFYLSHGADPDVGWHNSTWTPLHEAAYYNKWRAMEILLGGGADPDIQTTRSGWRGGAPLHYIFDGSRANSGRAVSVLVSGGAEVNARDNRGRSGLDLAARQGDADAAAVLRGAGGVCFVETGPLCEVEVATLEPVVGTVVASDTVCTAGSLSADGMTRRRLNAGLISAARGNDLAGVCEYLRRGASVDAQESEWRYYKRTPLMIAAMDGNLELGKLLRRNGADVNLQVGNYNNSVDAHHYQGNRRMPALHYAAGAGRKEFVEWLLSEGANVRALQALPRDALWEAAFWGRPEIVRILLTAGADANKLATGENLALWDAVHHPTHWAKYGNPRWGVSDAYARPTDEEWVTVISILVANGADVNVREPQGASPLDIAVRRGNAYYAELMREYGSRCFVETGPLCGVAVATPVASDTVCAAGSLSASGKTQAQLDAGLISAARANDLPGVCEHLRRGASVEARESTQAFRRTALMIAASDGFFDLAKLLYANGANVNRQAGNHNYSLTNDSPGWSALHYAATAGHANIVSWLLDSGADVDARWGRGGSPSKTALWEASFWGRADVVEILLSRGADPEGGGGPLPLHGAAIKVFGGGAVPSDYVMVSYDRVEADSGAYATVVSLLASRVSDVNRRAGNNWSALDYAARDGQTRIAEVLRDFGGRCFVRTGPLCEVATATPDPSEVVATVVANDAVCTAGSLSANGKTQRQLDAGLISAAKENDLPKVCEHLRRGADIEARENTQRFRRTALMIAASDGFFDLAKLLYANGANVNRQAGNHRGWHNDSPGWSALHYAATAGHANIVSWLLDSGADVDARWGWGGVPGKSVLWEAAHWGRADVVKILLDRGADPEGGRDPWPLHGAAIKLFGGNSAPSDFVMVNYSRVELDSEGYATVVSLLASRVSDVNWHTGNNWTALDYAANEGQTRIAEVLRDLGGRCFVKTGPLCEVATATPDPAEVIATVVASDTVCAAGSLSANGMTQAQLDAGLIAAAGEGDLTTACEYLRRGANPNGRDAHQHVPLMHAKAHLDMGELLLANGADKYVLIDGNGWWSPLFPLGGIYTAAQIEFYLSRGVDPNFGSLGGGDYDWRPLHEAAFYGKWNAIKHLLDGGAVPNVHTSRPGWRGRTPLHEAVGDSSDSFHFAIDASNPPFGMIVGNSARAVSVLLEGGAEVNARDGRGYSPLDRAAVYSKTAAAAVLRAAGGRCFVRTGPLCGEARVAVEYSSSANGTVSADVESGGEVARGATVAFTATPAEGFYVSGWTGGCVDAIAGSVGDGGAKVCSLIAEAALSVGAVFAEVPSLAGPECPGGTMPGNGLTQAELNTQLRLAARNGDTRKICEMLRRGAEVNDNLDGNEFTALQEAVSGGHKAAAEMLLANDAHVNARKGGTGPAPLDLAAQNENAEIAQILRDAHGQCFVETGPLCGEYLPAATLDPSTIAVTVTTTATVAIKDLTCPTEPLSAEGSTGYGWSRVMYRSVKYSRAKDYERVCRALRQGADPNGYVDGDGDTPLHRVFEREENPSRFPNWRKVKFAMAKLLIERGADVNALNNPVHPSERGISPLYMAMHQYCRAHLGFCEKVVKLLVDNGADVNLKSGLASVTPLHILAEWGDVNAADEKSQASYNRMAAMLIRAGADVNAKKSNGFTLLHDIFSQRPFPDTINMDLVKMLIDNGADVNAKSRIGWTPLHSAIRSLVYLSAEPAIFEGMKFLVANGADVNLESNDGETPAQFGRDLDISYRVIVWLEEVGSPVAVVPESDAVPESVTEELQEDFQEAFSPAPAFGDAFGAAASPGRFLTRLDSLMRATAGTGDVWDSFSGWQKENDFGRVWFSTGQRGDFGFGAGSLGGGESGFGKVLDANPFAALSGNGMLAGGETGFGESGKLRVAAFGDYESQSLLSGEDGKWTRWAASGTAIETAMSEAERFSGLSENKTRGAMTEFHLGGADAGVALQAGAVSESESALGGTARNESLRGLRSRTAFAGLSGSAALLGTGWRLRGAAHVGRSWAESDGMLRSSDLWASAFSAGLERGGWLYSDDGFVLRFSQPLRVEIWERELANDNGIRRMGISPSGRQLDVDAAYRLPLSGGGWLLFSAGVRRDGGHSSGSGVEGGALFAVEKGF